MNSGNLASGEYSTKNVPQSALISHFAPRLGRRLSLPDWAAHQRDMCAVITGRHFPCRQNRRHSQGRK